MSILRDLHIFNPFSETDLQVLETYCIENNNNIYNDVKDISKNYAEKQYKHQEEVNILTKKIFYSLKDNKISNLIIVELEKDTKTANVYPKIKTHSKNQITELTDYLILNNDMEEVFVFVRKDDIKTITNLLENNFISLSSMDSNESFLPFLKEKQIEKESSRFI